MDPELVAGARAVAFAARGFERALDDMTLPQFRVLALLAGSPERASRIAERAAVSRPSLTGILDGLEARHWVKRDLVVGDRRGVQLTVTAAGRRALARADGQVAAALDAVLEQLAPTDAAVAIAGLGALQRALLLRRDRAVTASGARP